MFPNSKHDLLRRDDMNAKLRLKLKRKLKRSQQKQVTASVESDHQRLLIQF
jgi:hypothetical protein